MRVGQAALFAATLVLAGCDTQKPSEPSLPAPHIISGSLTLPSGCSAAARSAGQPGEPSLAVDPTDPKRLIAAWLDNRSPDMVGIVVAISKDGGKQWSRSALPSLLDCGGGRYVHG